MFFQRTLTFHYNNTSPSLTVKGNDKIVFLFSWKVKRSPQVEHNSTGPFPSPSAFYTWHTAWADYAGTQLSPPPQVSTSQNSEQLLCLQVLPEPAMLGTSSHKSGPQGMYSFPDPHPPYKAKGQTSIADKQGILLGFEGRSHCGHRFPTDLPCKSDSLTPAQSKPN